MLCPRRTSHEDDSARRRRRSRCATFRRRAVLAYGVRVRVGRGTGCVPLKRGSPERAAAPVYKRVFCLVQPFVKMDRL